MSEIFWNKTTIGVQFIILQISNLTCVKDEQQNKVYYKMVIFPLYHRTLHSQYVRNDRQLCIGDWDLQFRTLLITGINTSFNSVKTLYVLIDYQNWNDHLLPVFCNSYCDIFAQTIQNYNHQWKYLGSIICQISTIGFHTIFNIPQPSIEFSVRGSL